MSWNLLNINKPKRYTLHEGDNLVLVNYDGLDMDARQVFESYDTHGKYRTGLIVTDTDIKSMSLALRKRKDLYRGKLYIKAETEKDGLWELTMEGVRFKQLEGCGIWFHHDGISALNIIKRRK